MKWLQKITDLLNYPTACMLYVTHLVSMLHSEPAWIHPSGVLKYTSSTYATIFLCQVYETAGVNTPNIGSRGLEVYFCFLLAMSHIGLQSWRVTHNIYRVYVDSHSLGQLALASKRTASCINIICTHYLIGNTATQY